MTHANTRHDGDLKESAVAVKDAVVDLAGEARRYAGQRVSDARDSAAAVLETVKSKAEDYNDTVVGFIRKNPYKSLAIAAGVGLAAGYLLRRR